MDNQVVILSLLAGFRVAVFDLVTTLRRVYILGRSANQWEIDPSRQRYRQERGTNATLKFYSKNIKLMGSS